jgi:hypothetical protein
LEKWVEWPFKRPKLQWVKPKLAPRHMPKRTEFVVRPRVKLLLVLLVLPVKQWA